MSKTREEFLRGILNPYIDAKWIGKDKGTQVIINHILSSSLFTVELPKEKKVLDLNANIRTENEYVRHKERVTGYNQALKEIKETLEKQGLTVKERS